MLQPLTGPGSVAETNRLLGGDYFDSTGKSLKEFVPVGTPATPAGILSSSAGKSVVNTKITPAVTTGTTAQTLAGQNQATNQQANDAQAEADAANATPSDMTDPLQARADANQKAQRDALRQEQQLYKELTIANTEQTASQVRTLQGAWATVQRQQQETNRSAETNLTTAGLRAGTARYAPTMNEGMISAQRSYGIQQLQEIDAKYNAAISSANAALAQNNLQTAMASAKASQEYLQQAAKEIQDQITNVQKIASDAAKSKMDLQKDIATNVATKLVGAPPAVLAAVSRAQSITEAVMLAGPYLANASGVVGEWQAVNATRTAQGKPLIDIETYMNADANRKRPVTNITMGDSGYTSKQVAAITRINDSISKNATYSKTSSMRNYADNVKASLSQETGVGDIAAINQFQKVIDEGAVTRDQDVKLIQGAQSLSNQLKLKIKKLEKGDALSPDQRTQIKKLVDDMYTSQVKALEKDPYIAAKKKEVKLNGLSADDTILSELSGFGGDTANDAANVVDSANAKIIDLGKRRPELQPVIIKFSNTVLPSTGQAPTVIDIYQWAKANNYVQ